MNKFLINLIPIKKIRKKKLAEYSFEKLCKRYPIYKDNFIQQNASLNNINNIKLGGKVYIGENCRIFAEGGLTIGAYTKIGEDCLIMTTNHNYQSENRIPYDHIGIASPINIGKNVWIGARSIILAGVKISDGAIIAAGSVVTKSVPYCAIVGGNPAKIIKFRDIKKYEKLESEGKNYPQEVEPPCEIKILQTEKTFIKPSEVHQEQVFTKGD